MNHQLFELLHETISALNQIPNQKTAEGSTYQLVRKIEVFLHTHFTISIKDEGGFSTVHLPLAEYIQDLDFPIISYDESRGTIIIATSEVPSLKAWATLKNLEYQTD